LHSEKDILLACQKNPSDGQRLLYLKFAPLLKGICFRYIKDRDEANDILQDSFVKIFNKIHSFEGNGSLEGWLKRVVVNTALDHLQKKKAKLEISYSVDESPELIEPSQIEHDDENVIAKVIDAGFSKEMLVQLLHKLPHQYATVFNMFFIDEISHREISELLNTTESNSRKLAFRAKEQVKTLLLEHLKTANQNDIWKIKIK
jgi:RNA polymerase sigma-70 factor, ECF subfamily